MASQYAGWQVARRQVLRDGLRPDAGRLRQGRALRPHPRPRAAAGRRRRAGDAQAARRGGRRLSRARSCSLPADQAHAAGRPGLQPGRQRAGGGPLAGDGPAQAARAEVRPEPGGLRLRHRAAAAGRQRRPRRHRPHQRRHPLRRPGRRSGCGADDDQLAELGPKVPSSASPDHGAPFADIFQRATSRTSTRSTRCSSARPRWCFRTSGLDGVIRSGNWRRTYWCDRSARRPSAVTAADQGPFAWIPPGIA